MRLGCRLREKVGGIAFPDRSDAFWTESEGWAAVQRPMEKLIEESPSSEALRQRYGQLLRGDVPLDAENLESALRLQYDLQVQRLASLGLLQADEQGERFITAIDGKHYPLPAFEDVLARMQTAEMQKKLAQGFDTLLLVPFGLGLERLVAAWGDGLRRNAGHVPELRDLNREQPVWQWEQYQREPLVYGPLRFASDHGGRTKEQILQEDGRGWDVLLVEGSMLDLPREGQGKRIGGRRQVECGRSAEEYLRDLPKGEVGWTPEAYIVRFLDALERSDTVLDHQTLSLLTGAYLPSSRIVPGAFWYPFYGRARLGGRGPDYRDPVDGARAAVRVG